MQRHSRHCPPAMVSWGMGTGRSGGGGGLQDLSCGSPPPSSCPLLGPVYVAGAGPAARQPAPRGAWRVVGFTLWTAATSCGGRVPIRPESSDGILFASCLCLSCRGQPGIATRHPRDAGALTLEIEAGQGYRRPSRWDLVAATQHRGAPVPVFTAGLGPRGRG